MIPGLYCYTWLHFAVKQPVALLGQRGGGWDVVDGHLYKFNLFLEAGPSCNYRLYNTLKLLSRLQKGVGGGGGHSNQATVVVFGERDQCNWCLGQGSID